MQNGQIGNGQIGMHELSCQLQRRFSIAAGTVERSVIAITICGFHSTGRLLLGWRASQIHVKQFMDVLLEKEGARFATVCPTASK